MTKWGKIFKKGINVTTPHEDIPRIIKFSRKRKVKKILDLGSGSGRHIIYLAKRGFDVYGTDSAKEGINLTKKWLKQLNLKAHLKITSFFKRFPFKNNFFEAVISIWAIHHGKEKQIKYCIKEIERVLKPQGLIFIAITSTIKGRPIEKIKKIEPHTYVVLKGLEKGISHHIFTKNMVKEYFKNFEILDLHLDKLKHWCILGISKKGNEKKSIK